MFFVSLHVKNWIIDTTTPAGCKGTNNYLNRQAISKIIASIAGKFKANGLRLVDFSESEGQVTTRTHPYAEQAIKACVELVKIIKGKEGEERLEKWVADNKKSECRKLAAFAYYIELDMKAVKVACSEYYNNGPMEGTVNKIKVIKRLMFNKAGVQLLRAKIIYANYSQSP